MAEFLAVLPVERGTKGQGAYSPLCSGCFPGSWKNSPIFWNKEETISIQHQTSNIWHLTSNIKHQTSNIWHSTWKVKDQATRSLAYGVLLHEEDGDPMTLVSLSPTPRPPLPVFVVQWCTGCQVDVWTSGTFSEKPQSSLLSTCAHQICKSWMCLWFYPVLTPYLFVFLLFLLFLQLPACGTLCILVFVFVVLNIHCIK